MKVALFTNEFPPNIYGGAGVHVHYLSRELSKIVSLNVHCFGNQNAQSKNLRTMGVELDPSLLRGIPKELAFVFSTFHKNLKWFQNFDSDLVHCHTWYAHLAGIFAKMAYGVPLVVTTHSLEPLRPWKREQLGLGYDVTCWVERQALTMADAIIAVSQSTKEDILKNFSVNEKKIHVITNGIDTQEYHPVQETNLLSRYGIDPAKPTLLYVGRVTRQKGIIHLVRALPFLDPEIQVVFCAGAPDTQEIKQEMETQIAWIQKKRKNIVWIQEMLPQPDILQIYSHASVFCCPSVYEPFGIINLEAMACGTPVVGTKIGGIPEIIEDGKTGILVPVDVDSLSKEVVRDNFSKDLASAIQRLFQDSKLRKRMGQKSRARAVKVFAWQSIAKKVFAVYRGLLETKKKNLHKK
jgi:glycogen synthase